MNLQALLRKAVAAEDYAGSLPSGQPKHDAWLVAADAYEDAGWPDAADACRHVASLQQRRPA